MKASRLVRWAALLAPLTPRALFRRKQIDSEIAPNMASSSRLPDAGVGGVRKAIEASLAALITSLALGACGANLAGIRAGVKASADCEIRIRKVCGTLEGQSAFVAGQDPNAYQRLEIQLTGTAPSQAAGPAVQPASPAGAALGSPPPPGAPFGPVAQVKSALNIATRELANEINSLVADDESTRLAKRDLVELKAAVDQTNQHVDRWAATAKTYTDEARSFVKALKCDRALETLGYRTRQSLQTSGVPNDCPQREPPSGAQKKTGAGLLEQRRYAAFAA
jgi:hypothetical protein